MVKKKIKKSEATLVVNNLPVSGDSTIEFIFNKLTKVAGVTDVLDINMKDVTQILKSFNCKDNIELTIASQYVAAYLMGMHSLTSPYLPVRNQSIYFNNMSYRALETLARYREIQRRPHDA